MAKTFQCALLTPEKQLFDEQIAYASIPAWDGLLGVEYQRAPLVVQLGTGPLRLDTAEGDPRWFLIDGGFAQMKDNVLTLLSDEAIPSDQIDDERASEAMAKAKALAATNETAVEQKQRDTTKARVMSNLAKR